MGSDRARITYNEKQKYRGVIAQQGRVTLEADWNEAQQIVQEGIDRNACDFVGPTGTPDDGYGVIPASGVVSPGESAKKYDFGVQQGTMYVGGMRIVQDTDRLYSKQSTYNWTDYGKDPDWVTLEKVQSIKPAKEFVYLYLREQEVSSVEDRELLEPAIGGPDTTQRVRLLQRIVRKFTNEATCQGALDAAAIDWKAKQGLEFKPDTMRLESMSRLKVIYVTSTEKSNLCEPTANGSYLEAENQLIRVQISCANPATPEYKLVWGFDNASFLYKVNVEPDLITLVLQSPPIDDKHQPRAQQAVEVLPAAAKLSNEQQNEQQNKPHVAASTGQIFTLSEPYNPDTKKIKLSNQIDPGYDLSRPIFLRVWEEEITFSTGDTVELGKTGVQVTISTTYTPSNGKPFHVGDYWQIAIRPGTSTPIYPNRYTSMPQPPDGPRLWVCPLAVVEWTQDGSNYKQSSKDKHPSEDCRQKFDNLVKLTKRPTSSTSTIIKVQELNSVALGVALGIVSALYTFIACMVCKDRFCQPFFCFSNPEFGSLIRNTNYSLVKAKYMLLQDTPIAEQSVGISNLVGICFFRALIAFIIFGLMGFLIAAIYNWWVNRWGQRTISEV